MGLITQEMRGRAVVAGARRYTPVAGRTRVGVRLLGRELGADYTRPLRIEVTENSTRRFVKIPDRQLHAMLVLWTIVILARLKMARRDS